jgi:hypothetical protein
MPPLDDLANGTLRCIQGLVDCGARVVFPALHHHAWQPADDHLGRTNLVDAASWSVRVADTHGDAFDRPGELPQPEPDLAPDIRALREGEPHPGGSDVRWWAARIPLAGTWDLCRERAPSDVPRPHAFTQHDAVAGPCRERDPGCGRRCGKRGSRGSGSSASAVSSTRRPVAGDSRRRGWLAGRPCSRILQRVGSRLTGGLGSVTFRRRSVAGFSVGSAHSGLGRIHRRVTTRPSRPLGKLWSAAFLLVPEDLRSSRHVINLVMRANRANYESTRPRLRARGAPPSLGDAGVNADRQRAIAAPVSGTA